MLSINFYWLKHPNSHISEGPCQFIKKPKCVEVQYCYIQAVVPAAKTETVMCIH